MGRKILQISMLIGALIAIAVGVSFLFPSKTPTPLKPLPNPNGYDVLVHAGQMITGHAVDYTRLSRDDLVMLVTDNTNALQLARTGLLQESQVPMQPSMVYFQKHVSTDLLALRKLSQTFGAESRLAELDGRTGDAANSAMDNIRLGHATARGGLLLDEMHGIAIESMGARSLDGLARTLDAKTSREFAVTLETLDGQREPMNDVMDRERDWARWISSAGNPITRWMSSRMLKPSMARAELKYNDQTKRTRQLMIDLAARAYEVEKGHKAKSASDLVPDYVKAIPKDPITGTNMVLLP